MNFERACTLIKAEVSQFQVNNLDSVEATYSCLEKSERIFILAAGRSLLMMKGFAMRLMHLGYEVHVLDEITCPALTEEDALFIASGSGSTAGIIEKAKKAKGIGASIIVWTQSPNSPLAELSDVCVPMMKQISNQPGASLFEQSLLLALDAFIAAIMEEKQLPPDVVYKRHANLE